MIFSSLFITQLIHLIYAEKSSSSYVPFFFLTEYRVFTEYVTNINQHIEDMCASVRVLNVAKLFYLPLFMSTIKW